MKEIAVVGMFLTALIPTTIFAGQFNTSKMESAREYYEEQIPADIPSDEVYCIYNYSDAYRGSFDWCIYDNYWDLEYYDENDYISLSVDLDAKEIDFDIDILYEDDGTRFRLNLEEMKASDINKAISTISTMDRNLIDNDSAMESHDVQGDVQIMYARFIDLSEEAMKKIPGINGLADFGLKLENTSKADPAQVLSKEVPFIINKHNFKDGTCIDGDITWNEFVIEGMRELGNFAEGERCGLYAMPNEYLVDSSDMVQFYYANHQLVADYRNIMITDNRTRNIIQHFDMDLGEQEEIVMTLEYEDVFPAKDSSGEEVTQRFKCRLDITATPDQVDDVLVSKEAIMDNSSFKISSYCTGGENYEYFDGWPDEDIQKFMNEIKYTMITKEELCEKLFQNHTNYILAIDKSMIELGTSLAGKGIEIDNIK